MSGLPRTVEIMRVQKETVEHMSFYFEYYAGKPGQFLMVWIPGVDEKPISLSRISNTECGITIQCKGQWSKSACALSKGMKIGVRGPYGNGFDLKEYKKVVIVAGGCGAAPLRPLVEECLSKGIGMKMILGAKTSSQLLFKQELLKKLGNRLYITTDDGSEGRKGFVTDAIGELLGAEKPDCIFSCGPEVMMKAVLDQCEYFKINCQFSLERYMRCGFGVCGQCVMDDLMVCKDGPVFPGEVLRKSKEFGSIARLKSGREVSLREYAEWRQV
ncbi:dihydroorotate dehydrogenase electron transfer subunit [Candidatus Micrarchaeota archaeon]|nr:dihydroorotate dehydrogenase electron transfer subunit [Candidatus Micrarchaeota archaeon]